MKRVLGHPHEGWAATGPEVGVSSDELRALGPSEIIGDLRYGQTSAIVSYTENPLYRAFRFQGKRGDVIDAWVRSTSGDARAWLLDAAFQNVVTNDNANASTTDSRLLTTLKRDGAYYVAFREATREDASFTVSLQGTPASPTCDPEVENCPDGSGGADDPFDSASCSGPPITVAEAERWFPLGATVVKVSTALAYIQKRTCVRRSTAPECTPWRDAGTTAHDLVFTQQGTGVEASLSGPFYQMVGSPTTYWDGFGYVGTCAPGGNCVDEVSTYIDGRAAGLRLTRNCVRAGELSYSSARENPGATTWYERRAVILGRFNPR